MGFFTVLALFVLVVVLCPRGNNPRKAVADSTSLSNRLDDSHDALLGCDLTEMDSMFSLDSNND